MTFKKTIILHLNKKLDCYFLKSSLLKNVKTIQNVLFISMTVLIKKSKWLLINIRYLLRRLLGKEKKISERPASLPISFHVIKSVNFPIVQWLILWKIDHEALSAKKFTTDNESGPLRTNMSEFWSHSIVTGQLGWISRNWFRKT